VAAHNFRTFVVEVGSFALKGRGAAGRIFLYPSTAVEAIPPRDVPPPETARGRAGRLRALLESGAVSSRAELARQLGVSRARVSQILGAASAPKGA
jgi:DNA invertase Pin-like site-specific DNA recombinase